MGRIQPWIPFVVMVSLLMIGLSGTGRVATGDAPHILAIGQKLSGMLAQGEFLGFYESISSLVSPHPPGGYLLVVALDLIGWSNLPVGVSVCGLALAWHGMVLLVSREGRSRWGPWLGGLLMMASGLLWFSVEQMAWDLLAAGCVVACIGHLHASDGLRKLGHGLCFGLFMGLGFVTKYTFPAFLILPVLFAGWAVVRFRAYAGLCIAIAAFLVVAGPWYLGHAQSVLAYVAHSSDAAATLSDSPASTWAHRLSAENLLYYPTVLRDTLGWPGLFVLGLAFSRAWSSPAGRWSAWGVVGGGLVLTFAGENQSRYFLPAIPLIAAIVDIGIRPGFGQSLSRFGLVAGLSTALPAAWGSWTAYSSNERAPASRDQTHAVESLAGWGDWPWVAGPYRPISNPITDWRVDEALGALAMATGPGSHQVGLLLPRDMRLPPASTYAWRAGSRGLDWDFASVVTGGPSRRPMIFVGPLKPLGHKISRKFSVAYAVYPKGRPPAVMQALSAVASWTHPLPSGFEGAVYTVPANGWESELGQALKKDPIDG